MPHRRARSRRDRARAHVSCSARRVIEVRRGEIVHEGASYEWERHEIGGGEVLVVRRRTGDSRLLGYAAITRGRSPLVMAVDAGTESVLRSLVERITGTSSRP